MSEKIKGYKGFLSDLSCRDVKYEVGRMYVTEEQPAVCHRGFHLCQDPTDVPAHYAPYHLHDQARYCIVEGGGALDRSLHDTKVACQKLTVVRELDYGELAKEWLEYMKDSVVSDKGMLSVAQGHTEGQAVIADDQAAALAGGRESVAYGRGECTIAATMNMRSMAFCDQFGSIAAGMASRSVAAVKGLYSVAVAMTFKSVASAMDKYTAAVSMSSNGLAEGKGDHSIAVNGNLGDAVASGKFSVAVGNGGYVEAKNPQSSAVCLNEGKAKGVVGSSLVFIDGGDVVCVKVDGVRIKENEWYDMDQIKRMTYEDRTE